MKWTDLRQQSDSALESELEKLVETLRTLRFQGAVGQLENPLDLRANRRKIARIRTILRERQKKANVG